jgi:hypothetical protein
MTGAVVHDLEHPGAENGHGDAPAQAPQHN